MLLVIFGKPAAGKSYLGNVLQKTFGFFHYDGDEALPLNMKKALLKGQRITDRQRNMFFNRLLQEVKKIVVQHKNIVVSQTFIRERYRLHFLKNFPNAQSILVYTNTLIREKRLSKRKKFQLKKNYQRKMSLIFEPPHILHHVINNNAPGEKMLVAQLQATFPSLKNTFVH